jgi:hypothetical protein
MRQGWCARRGECRRLRAQATGEVAGLDRYGVGNRGSARLDRLAAARREGAARRQVGEIGRRSREIATSRAPLATA